MNDPALWASVHSKVALAMDRWNEYTPVMNESPLTHSLLTSFGESMDATAAQAILNLRATPEVQEYVATLADRSREGLLTPAEQREYEGYTEMVSTISLLQAQARRVIKKLAA